MNNLQKTAYKNSKWKEFSRKVIEAHQCQCSRCNRQESEGVILQVHHKYYNPEMYSKPWNYPLNAFEVLCKGCHAQEHGHIMPMDGWEHIDMVDMEEPSVECEYPNCTYDDLLRYVHIVFHPKWGFLNVGCGHSNKLTGTTQATEIEKEVKKKQKMFDSFLTKEKWQQVGDNRWYREFVHFPITITQQQESFQITIFIPLPESYQTLDQAMKAAFDLCYNQLPQHFFQQHGIPYPELIQRKPRSKKNPIIYHNQLIFAINNKTGRLVHIDSVEPDVLCNCICPSCQQPLKAENTLELRNKHCFVHLNETSCEEHFLQMYRRLILQLIEQEKQIFIPQYNNNEAKLHIPSFIAEIKSFLYKTSFYDALLTCSINGLDRQVGIIIDVDGTISDQQKQFIKSSEIPTIQISLIKQYNTTHTLQEVKDLLRAASNIFTWLHCPHYDTKAAKFLQDKEQYLVQLKPSIQQSIDNCICGGYEIKLLGETYTNHKKYQLSVKQLFIDTIKTNIQRIIFEPSIVDLQHTEECIKIITWYQHYDTIQGINHELLSMLRYCNFVDSLLKKQHNHTEQRFKLLYNLFKYYFINEVSYYRTEDKAKVIYNNIRKSIQTPFLNHSPILNKEEVCSKERKMGMELCFLLYLYYGVERIGWNTNKKERMFREINNADNLPIFAAIGSLWFGHIFNRFQTDDLQIFIHTIATKLPKAAPWVIRYIEKTNYRDYCMQNNISYSELELIRNEYHNVWLDGIFYSALPYYFDSARNRNELYPKVSLPQVT